MSSIDVGESASTEQAAATAAEPSQLSTVLDVLGDDASRTILRVLRDARSPLTVQELSSISEVALTSAYRKLDGLTEAGLLEEREELDPDGHRRSRYRPAVDKVEVSIGAADGAEVRLYTAVSELGVGDR